MGCATRYGEPIPPHISQILVFSRRGIYHNVVAMSRSNDPLQKALLSGERLDI